MKFIKDRDKDANVNFDGEKSKATTRKKRKCNTKKGSVSEKPRRRKARSPRKVNLKQRQRVESSDSEIEIEDGDFAPVPRKGEVGKKGKADGTPRIPAPDGTPKRPAPDGTPKIRAQSSPRPRQKEETTTVVKITEKGIVAFSLFCYSHILFKIYIYKWGLNYILFHRCWCSYYHEAFLCS